MAQTREAGWQWHAPGSGPRTENIAAPPGRRTAHPQYNTVCQGPNQGSFIRSDSQQVDTERQLVPGSALSAESKTGVYTLA